MLAQKIYVVDDDADVRNGLAILLETESYPVQLFGSADDFWQAFEANLHELAGCLILDIRMAGMNGLELHQRLAGAGCALPVIFLTGHAELPDAVAAMRKGAIDFLTKPVKGDELLQRLELVWKTEQERCRVAILQSELRTGLARLSAREREVLMLGLQGRQNRDIATVLDLSLRTVEAHRSRLLLKLNAATLQAWLHQCEAAALTPAAVLDLLGNFPAERQP
jgi:FixJ family two-component response regulator